LRKLISNVNANLERFRFSDASDLIYQFMWHEIADNYIEHVKSLSGEEKITSLSVLRYVYMTGLKLLHPFMPFVTESIWENIPKFEGEEELLISSSWPEK